MLTPAAPLDSDQKRHSRGVARRVVSAATALILGVGTALAGASAAHAVASTTVSIQASNATTQPSGATFTYQINMACAGANDPSCNDTSIVIPLDATSNGDPWDMTAWGFTVSGGPAGFVQSWSVVGDELVIVLADTIATGTSQSIVLTVTPPNLVTPDGTMWSLQPTIVTDDPDTSGSIAPAAAVGTATATVPLSVAKTSDRTFYAEGETITYTITASCPTSKPHGSLYASSMTIVDTLPEGLEFDAASGDGVWNPIDRTITWTYVTPESVPTACGGEAPDAASSTQTVTATMGVVDGDPISPYDQVVNTVSVVAVPLGGGEESTRDASRTIIALGDGNDPITGTTSLGKTSSSPLNRSADDSPDFRATYPGRWLPNGDNSARPASMSDSNPASYRLTPRIQYEEHRYEITDPVPCLSNKTGVVYRAVDTGICTEPAFHVLGVRIDFSGTAPDAAYAPRFIDTSGDEHAMVLETAAAQWSTWTIPTSSLGQVAVVIIPSDASQEWRRADNIRIDGFADDTVTDGDVLQNQASIEWFLRDGDTAVRTQTSPNADIFILDTPQIGIAKSMSNVGGATGTQARVDLTATLLTPGVPSADVIITDLLPPGSMLVDDPESIGIEIRPAGSPAIQIPADELGVEVIDDAVDGQQLVRFTVRVDQLPPQAGRFDFVLDSFVVSKPSEPGIYLNRAQSFYDSATLAGQCFAGDYQSDDPDLLRGDESTVSQHCEAHAEMRTVTSTSGQFLLTKTVQGDRDDSPQGFPHLGHVALDDGEAVFTITWTNTGAPTLNGVVAYDVLPHIGDTGVSGDQAGEARGSEFRPLLTAVAVAPDGVTVSYSASQNPCRAEVYPAQGACDDDWSTDPDEVGGLENVHALKYVSTESYQTGEGFSVSFFTAIPSIDKDMVAWNTVAAFAQTTGGLALLPTESPRVGITGSDERFSLNKTVDHDEAQPGDTLTYEITVTNVGTVASVATTVEDQLPSGLTFVSTDGGGSYDPTTRVISWQVPALDRDDSIVFTVVATVNVIQASDELVNQATLVNPAGYSPPIVESACTDDPLVACAPTEVPYNPGELGSTGPAEWVPWAAIAATLLALGSALLLMRRLASRP